MSGELEQILLQLTEPDNAIIQQVKTPDLACEIGIDTYPGMLW